MLSKFAVFAAVAGIFGGMTFYGIWFVRIMGSNVVRSSDYLASPLK